MTTKSKYNYDYPDNRELGINLTPSDRAEIAEYLQFSNNYINRIFIIGDRTNNAAIEIAKKIIEQKKERKLIFTSK